MAKPNFLAAFWTERWKASYVRLSIEQQRYCDRAVMALIKRESSPGLRIKPIHPDKYYFEARFTSGDRVIFRIEGETIYFIDVVSHDDIARYARRPPR